MRSKSELKLVTGWDYAIGSFCDQLLFLDFQSADSTAEGAKISGCWWSWKIVGTLLVFEYSNSFSCVVQLTSNRAVSQRRMVLFFKLSSASPKYFHRALLLFLFFLRLTVIPQQNHSSVCLPSTSFLVSSMHTLPLGYESEQLLIDNHV